MAQKQFKIGLSNTDKQNMAQDVYERVLALTFNEYDTTTEYDVGDFVVYNDQLYKCISATSGAWDSSKWQLATLNDLVDDIENAVAFVNDKANVDGNYPTMTVGAADNMTPYDEDSGVDQEQPFLLQGTGCGNGEQQVDTGALALLKEKQGNTVVVNQAVKTKTKSFTTTSTSAEDISDTNYTFISSHKYLITARQNVALTSVIRNLVLIVIPGEGLASLMSYGSASGSFNLYATEDVNLSAGFRASIFDCSTSVTGVLHYWCSTPSENVTISEINVIDLTQWFGSNDNIPAHLLSHPEDFFRYYQGSLAYNEGTLVNSNGRYLKTIGRQQWDEVATSTGYIDNDGNVVAGYGTRIASSNYIKVIPNTDYYFRVSYAISSYGIRIAWYDKDKNLISVGNYYTATNKSPSNACYMRFNVNQTGYASETYNHDITISLYYEDESGYDQYYPYEELANIDTGTEILRSAGNVKDYKTPDGVVHRLVGNRAYQSGDENDSSLITDGTTTNYPLAEETTEQGTTFSENVAIDDFGSMDFAGTNGVPQGASIFYAVDYKAFVDSLYNTLDGDATDVVKDSELDTKLAALGYVKLTSVSGYDATKTQVLKNVEGTLTWVTEE